MQALFVRCIQRIIYVFLKGKHKILNIFVTLDICKKKKKINQKEKYTNYVCQGKKRRGIFIIKGRETGMYFFKSKILKIDI